MEILDALGTILLAIAAFYQIYHTEHKTESLRPRLVVFPEFDGELSSSQIVFYVYNTGKSMAKNCNATLTVAYKMQSINELRTVHFKWIEYNKVENPSGTFFIESHLTSRDFVNINPTQKASLNKIDIRDLYRGIFRSDAEVPPVTFGIRIDVYAENMTTGTSYPLLLKWTGKAFDINKDEIKEEIEKRIVLENKLRRYKHEELLKSRVDALKL